MPRLRRSTAFALAMLAVWSAEGSELQLLPSHARLDGPRASQQFLVESRDHEAWIGDLSKKAVSG